MHAARLHAVSDGLRLQLDDVPTPEPGTNEVLIKIRACGVNQVDLLTRNGRTPARPPLPHISGSEVTGDVAVIGEGVKSWKTGDRVVVDPVLSCGDCSFCRNGCDNICLRGKVYGVQTDGGYAEYAVVPARQLVRLPDSLSYESAAAVALTGTTAWHMLMRRANIHLGEDILVIAAGSGIGVMAVQIATLAGARVAATAGSTDKRELAVKLGASLTVNHRDPCWAEAVREWTGGRGVDVAFEHVGAATWEGSLRALARGGRLVTSGGHSGFDVTINLWHLFAKEHAILGSFAGSRQDLLNVLRLVEEGRLRPIIHDVLPLTEAAQAQVLLQDRKVLGKLLLDPSATDY